MIKQYLTALFVVLFSTFMSAQETWVTDELVQAPEERLYEMLQNIDISPLNSGVWLDMAIPMLDFERCMVGAADPLVMDYRQFKTAYLNIFTAQTEEFFDEPLSALETVIHNKDLTVPVGGTVPLGLIHVEAQRIMPSAVDDGLLTQDSNGNLHAVEGQNPFELVELMFLSPLAENIQGSSFDFQLPDELVFSNINTTQKNGSLKSAITQFQINADDGLGFRNAGISANGYKASGFSVDYQSAGIKTLEFRITFADGTEYTSQAKINIQALNTPVSTGYLLPILADPGRHAGGTAQIIYGCGSTGVISKPLIVVEGFDPAKSQSLFTFNKKLDKLVDGNTLKELMESEGYDIIYLNFKDATDDIWRNAEVLEDLITRVNELKVQNGSSYKNVVLGESMGGLVARCALREMEIDHGLDFHDTETFISWDTPHNGANIPLSLQMLMAEINEYERTYLAPEIIEIWGIPVAMGYSLRTFRMRDLLPEISVGIDILNTTAARQMVLRRPINTESLKSNLSFLFFEQINHADFGMPQGVDKLVALNNGSQTAKSQNNMFPGSDLISLDIDDLDLLKEEWKDFLSATIGAPGGFNFKGWTVMMLKSFRAFLFSKFISVNAKSAPDYSNEEKKLAIYNFRLESWEES